MAASAASSAGPIHERQGTTPAQQATWGQQQGWRQASSSELTRLCYWDQCTCNVATRLNWRWPTTPVQLLRAVKLWEQCVVARSACGHMTARQRAQGPHLQAHKTHAQFHAGYREIAGMAEPIEHRFSREFRHTQLPGTILERPSTAIHAAPSRHLRGHSTGGWILAALLPGALFRCSLRTRSPNLAQ